jgi:hypothetical protein
VASPDGRKVDRLQKAGATYLRPIGRRLLQDANASPREPEGRCEADDSRLQLSLRENPVVITEVTAQPLEPYPVAAR